VVVLVLAGYLGAADAAGQVAGSNPEQQAVPQEQAAARESAATQPTYVPSSLEPAPAVAPFNAEQAKRHQEAWAKHLGIPVELTNSIGMKLVLIPPGEFMMGSGESKLETARAYPPFPNALAGPWQLTWMFEPEHPQHRVRLTKPFHLGVFEVTQEQYEQVMGTNPSSFKATQNPMETVSWNDAVIFCDMLSALPAEMTADRTYRLPTEAEWENACRAGTTTRDYSTSDASNLDEHAWFAENSGGAKQPWPNSMGVFAGGTTQPVARKISNAWGLFDMHGNVWEWCADWYDADYYKSSPRDDPTGPATGSERTSRGGSWNGPAFDCRTATRGRNMPSHRLNSLGFRVVAILSDQHSSK
jgi:formylglycine-generating enzyme required for sulfatase activity